MSSLGFAKQFTKDTKGNVASIFAVSLVGIFGAMGLGMDTINIKNAQLKLQGSADAASLAVAKSRETDPAKMLEIATAFFADRPEFGAITVNAVTRVGNSYRVDASRATPTYLMHLFGKDIVNVRVVADTTLDLRELNLAMVLDTTGSMSGTKITSLKTAATNLINELDSANSSSVKVSVIPFSQYVNVGMSRRNAPWMDVPADSVTTGAPVCRMVRDVVSRSNPRRVDGTCYNDGVAYTCSRTEYDTVTYSAPYERCDAPESRQTWYGCAGSRLAPDHLRVAYNGRRVPGAMNVRCGTEMLPLTSNFGDMRSTINALTPQGQTYIPAGVMWGWRALNSAAPLTEIASASADAEKYMIIMTDGANTKSKTGLTHDGNNSNDANAVTRQLCTNVKSDGITVFTIAYDITDNATRNLMQSCASSPAQAFDASNPAQLNAAFADIGQSLLNLRLTN